MPKIQLYVGLLIGLYFCNTTQASIRFIQFSGVGNASGEVNSVAYNNEDWLVELGVEDEVTDSSTNNDVGQFVGAVTSAVLVLGETTYHLAGDTLEGQISITAVEGSANYGSINWNPASGGYLTFYATLSLVKPVIFTNQNALGSLVTGSSAINSQSNGNSSNASFQVYMDPHLPEYSQPGLIGANGESIELFVNAPSGSGEMAIAITEVSVIPEPSASIAILGLISACMVGMRRH
ncbi:hypothetical protein SH580_01830 [Coraliomargarita algicola]|uniref:PEP-CTERM protein-sorting domain-containing protein n=1 Tax=Coraliomargarita algicola TaxID=3092156 RepID=A0ABZ0RNW5_9BACT|nr:hypothetical protein [Coraliomargarita sp. J2-16]WPJ96440.1 hypothetical protein SH580_01830 [Coraliomargarita sp. J2-16]